MKNKKGFSLVETLICVFLIPIALLSIASGITTLRNLQYRTDSLTRLSSAASGVMETWKTKKIEDLKEGVFKADEKGLRGEESIKILVKSADGGRLMEIKVVAENNDARSPQRLVYKTLVAK